MFDIATQVESTRINNLSQRLESIAKAYPERIAMRCGEDAVNYRDLLKLVNKLNYKLQQHPKWHPGMGVAFDLEKSIPAMALIFAIFKSGGHYIPISSQSATSRVQEIMAISGATLLFTDKKKRLETLSQGKVDFEIISLVDYLQDLGEEEADMVEADIAYIIFTSGSEGTPKGVVVSHRSICHVASACYKRFFENAEDRGLIKTPLRIALNSNLSFDASVIQYLIGLMYGNELVLLPEELKEDLFAFESVMKKERVDIIDITPTQLSYYIRTFGDNEDFYLPEIIINVGEALTRDFAGRIFSFQQVKRLINAYGPTESCVFSHVKIMDEWEDIPYRNLSIGRPIEGLTHFILDSDGRPVPRGKKGELWLESSYLSNGYCGEDNGFGRVFFEGKIDSRAKLYRTGDIVEALQNGELVCLGRIGRQVKIHGQRFELGELEALLRRHQSIEDAKAILYTNKTAEEIIVFCQGYAKKEELDSYLKTKINAIFLPKHYCFLETFPMNKNGKVDESALIHHFETHYDERISSSVDRILEILDKIDCSPSLKAALQEPIGFHEMDSIEVFLLSSMIYQKWGKEIHPEQLRKCCSFNDLRRLIGNSSEFGGSLLETPESIAIGPRHMHLWLREMKAKKKGYRLDQEKGAPVFTVLLKVMLSKYFDPGLMEEAIRKLAFRHDCLHSKLEKRENKWYLTKVDSFEFAFDVVKTDGADDIDYVSYLRDFKANQAPLFQILLIEESEKQTLYFHFHHLITDPLSLYTLIQEWVQLMEGIHLKPLRNDYFAFMLKEQEPDPQLTTFWNMYLKDRKHCKRWGVSHDKLAASADCYHERRIVLGGDTYSGILAYAKRHNVSLFAYFIKTFYDVLQERTIESDQVIGIMAHGRNRRIEGISQMQGLFVTACPLRIRLKPSASDHEKLKEIQTSVNAVLDHQGLDVWQIYKSMDKADQFKGELMSIFVNYLEDQEFKVIGTDTHVSVSELGGNPKQKVDYINIRKRNNRFEIDISLPGMRYSAGEADALVYCIQSGLKIKEEVR